MLFNTCQIATKTQIEDILTDGKEGDIASMTQTVEASEKAEREKNDSHYAEPGAFAVHPLWRFTRGYVIKECGNDLRDKALQNNKVTGVLVVRTRAAVRSEAERT